MKKVISIALLLALCLSVLAGCSTPAVDFTDAIEYLDTAMDDIGTKVFSAFHVISDITIGGTAHYSVAWTSDNADVTFADDAAKPGTKKVSIPKRATTDVTFTLTAVISDDNGNKAEALNYTLTIPAMPPLPAADSNVTIKNALEIGIAHEHNTYTANKYYIEGEIVEIAHEQYGNMYIQDRDGNRLYLYGTYVAGIPFGDLDTKPAVGDTIKVYGAIGQYNDAAQVKNSTIVEVNGKAPEAPAGSNLTLVDDPKTGVAYKFGMVQTNAGGATYYLKGGMAATYYLATSTKVADAIDVYLENATGGYYLYAMIDGVKTYINMVVNGTHVNGVYEATASTVYTFDAELKTLVSTVNDRPYAFGTRNDQSHTTAGPSYAESSFVCQFYK
jgi:hypothetical protein